mgnify:CR=1 FL=1
MDIGSKVKRLRQANGLTLEELANRSELTKGFLSQLERDLTSPSVATLEDILEALGTNLQEFFSEKEAEQLVFKQDDFLKIFKMIIKFHILFLTLKKMIWNQF